MSVWLRHRHIVGRAGVEPEAIAFCQAYQGETLWPYNQPLTEQAWSNAYEKAKPWLKHHGIRLNRSYID